MRAILIRHGQSTGNTGIPSPDHSLIELTELGWSQSREVAAGWVEAPSLIVVSPFLRTRQTAAATLERFPNVPGETWPVEEFTYLEPGRWNGTLVSERMPFVERYWATCDPEFCDGSGAESFAALLARARGTLERLSHLSVDSLVYVFSHGQFIQAVRSLVTDPERGDRKRMSEFWGPGSFPIANGEIVELEWREGEWQVGGLRLKMVERSR